MRPNPSLALFRPPRVGAWGCRKIEGGPITNHQKFRHLENLLSPNWFGVPGILSQLCVDLHTNMRSRPPGDLRSLLRSAACIMPDPAINGAWAIISRAHEARSGPNSAGITQNNRPTKAINSSSSKNTRHFKYFTRWSSTSRWFLSAS